MWKNGTNRENQQCHLRNEKNISILGDNKMCWLDENYYDINKWILIHSGVIQEYPDKKYQRTVGIIVCVIIIYCVTNITLISETIVVAD